MPKPEIVRLAAAEWADQLAGLTGEHIARGLEVWKGDWPPSAPEFRRACTGDDGLHKSAAYRTYKALPCKPSDRETSLRFLRQIKRSIYRPATPQERYMDYLITNESR